MASKLVLVTLFLAAVAMASARPRFLAIPLEDVQFIDRPYENFRPVFVPQHRIRRAAQVNEPEAAGDKSRSGYAQAYGNDYVDYGAYTGGYGAFGWYTDHPVGGGYGAAYSG